MTKENLYNEHFGLKKASPNMFYCNTVVSEPDLELLNEFRTFLINQGIPLTSRSQLIRCAIQTLTMDDRTVSIAKKVLVEEQKRRSHANADTRKKTAQKAAKKKLK